MRFLLPTLHFRREYSRVFNLFQPLPDFISFRTFFLSVGSDTRTSSALHAHESLQDVGELEGTVFQLLQHIRVLRNHARPIPSRITLYDLRTCRHSPEYDSTPTLRDVISLTHVCRYWRAILLNHNGAWSDIHLRGQNPGFVTQQLERCGGAALSVNVHLQFWMFRRENTRLLNNIREALTDVHLHRNQVRRLGFPSVFQLRFSEPGGIGIGMYFS